MFPQDRADHRSVDIVHQNNKDLVYHVVHPLRIKWKTVLAGLSAAGMRYEATSPAKWVAKVEESVATREDDPSSGMLPMWKNAVGPRLLFALRSAHESSMGPLLSPHQKPRSMQASLSELRPPLPTLLHLRSVTWSIW
jgi:hypothetical protein